MALAPVCSDACFEHVRIGDRRPSQGKPCEGLNHPVPLFEQIEGIRPASISYRAKDRSPTPRFSRQGSFISPHCAYPPEPSEQAHTGSTVSPGPGTLINVIETPRLQFRNEKVGRSESHGAATFMGRERLLIPRQGQVVPVGWIASLVTFWRWGCLAVGVAFERRTCCPNRVASGGGVA